VTELKQSARALEAANAQLAEADRRKDEFLAVLSHELRNPLAPIRISVHLLERAEPGSDQARHGLQVIDRQVRHMTRLIEDLLDVTRIARGKIALQRERVDLVALARGSADDHRDLFEKNGVALQVTTPDGALHVDGDPTRLAQVIGNLLSNAAKFTRRGGHTELLVSEGAHDAIVRVRDDGVGMSPETLAHVFEAFAQAKQTLERSRGGLGLGLALVKGLVEMHGGRVEARSEGEQRGAELTVRLPLAAPTSAPRARPSVAPEPDGARRVLVIEDNEDAAESLRDVLELLGHRVSLAGSGPDGVARAEAERPDVILCDIGLPGLDGFGVARALRASPDPVVRAAFLVALSGYAQREDVARSREAGFDRHVAKPLGIEALEKLLAEAPRRS
jgi:two-component system CheB/CheR fusion protein